MTPIKPTHWLIFPDTPDRYAFKKAVRLDQYSCVDSIRSKGLDIRPISSEVDLPTKPQYKTAQ